MPEKIVKYLPYCLYALLGVFCINHCFFQDMIQLSSGHASWFYDNNFRYFLFPNNLDSGHPPLNGIMLAFWWKLFGKTLWVSHLFTLLWSMLLIYQVQKLARLFFSKETAMLISLVLLLDPTLLAQSVIVSPDIILLTFFFMALRASLERKNVLLTFAIVFLSLISMRGMMCCAAIFFFHHFNIWDKKNVSIKNLIINSLPFSLGALLAFAFLGYHYYKLGWIGYHENMPWADCFEKVNFVGFLRNIVFVIWRFLDFGRIILWILFFYAIFILLKKIKTRCFSFDKKEISIFFLFGALVLISSYSALSYKALSGHRYFLPHFIIFGFITFILLSKIVSVRQIQRFSIVVCIVLLCGNMLRYPEKISTGWDSTLSHLPYYSLRTQMFDYIEEHNISFSDISAGFGMVGGQNRIDFSSPKDRIIDGVLGEKKYYLYSNTFNAPDEDIETLHNPQKYALITKMQKGNVFICLYEKIFE
ncbi:MAG: glycosyltransferase family 39 protein [Dysgonamonadaceae bacterium]|jgi:hypothetical protein|nr:glycosyltransferase family 39 protein [Dysgonamonadaceae bacterium]